MRNNFQLFIHSAIYSIDISILKASELPLIAVKFKNQFRVLFFNSLQEKKVLQISSLGNNNSFVITIHLYFIVTIFSIHGILFYTYKK